MTAGPDGTSIWFAQEDGNKIGRISTTGTFTEFSLPTPDSRPRDIVVGPDGNLWFTEAQANKIGMITPTGQITEFPIPTPASEPSGIALGPDGNLWFTERLADKIGRLTLDTKPGWDLTVVKAGTGIGDVFSNPAGIDCGETCEAEFEEGAKVVLTAATAIGSKFSGWSGAGCSGTGSCVVTMSEARAVTATFDLVPPPKLTVAKEGTGSVTSFPEGIDCGKTCEANFALGETVSLVASPAKGSKFVSWEGCSPGGTSGTFCKFIMDEAKAVTAQFAPAAPSVVLGVAKAGTGTGTVFSEPEGINCGASCEAEFEEGEEVILIATPAPNSKFGGWKGCDKPWFNENECAVAMSEAKEVTATFDLVPVPQLKLKVAKEGTGLGRVFSEPSGIDCGETCEAAFPEGQTVQLTASPAKGSKFVSWKGCDVGGASGSSCKVTMSKAKTVTARFSLEAVSSAISVTKAGSGSGTVLSEPAGINCGETCSAKFTAGQEVVLVAMPAPGSKFGSWKGCDASGVNVNECVVTMSGAREVTATFDPIPRFTITVIKEGTGSGTVLSEPQGIDCGATCEAEFEVGTAVTLRASAGKGSVLVAWKGCDAGGISGNTCKVTTNAVIRAKFTATPGLALKKEGIGLGSVKSSPLGISCPAACASTEAAFAPGAKVTLTASPLKGAAFTGWNGCESEPAGKCVVTMSAAKAVEASFAPLPREMLTVEKTGKGAGTVKTPPAGVNCPRTCSRQVESFYKDTTVTLTQAPVKGSAFVEWTGACAGSGTCAVTMSEARTVGARFEPIGAPKIVPSFDLALLKAAGTGAGKVTSSAVGVNCDANCSATTAAFKSATTIVLKATPSSGSTFTEWGGACSGSGACEVTMSKAKEVTAKFTAIPMKTLVVEKAGGGTGSLASNPGGIDCGPTCPSAVAVYGQGTVVTLTAIPGKGSSSVAEWVGCDDDSTPNVCIVALDDHAAVVASFD